MEGEEHTVDWLTNISFEPGRTTGLMGVGVALEVGVTNMNFVIGCLSSAPALFPAGLLTHCSSAFWVSPSMGMEGLWGRVTG